MHNYDYHPLTTQASFVYWLINSRHIATNGRDIYTLSTSKEDIQRTLMTAKSPPILCSTCQAKQERLLRKRRNIETQQEWERLQNSPDFQLCWTCENNTQQYLNHLEGTIQYPMLKRRISPVLDCFCLHIDKNILVLWLSQNRKRLHFLFGALYIIMVLDFKSDHEISEYFLKHTNTYIPYEFTQNALYYMTLFVLFVDILYICGICLWYPIIFFKLEPLPWIISSFCIGCYLLVFRAYYFYAAEFLSDGPFFRQPYKDEFYSELFVLGLDFWINSWKIKPELLKVEQIEQTPQHYYKTYQSYDAIYEEQRDSPWASTFTPMPNLPDTSEASQENQNFASDTPPLFSNLSEPLSHPHAPETEEMEICEDYVPTAYHQHIPEERPRYPAHMWI